MADTCQLQLGESLRYTMQAAFSDFGAAASARSVAWRLLEQQFTLQLMNEAYRDYAMPIQNALAQQLNTQLLTSLYVFYRVRYEPL